MNAASAFGPPLPPMTEAERQAVRASLDAAELSRRDIWARQRRWRRFVTARGCPKEPGFARDAFLRDMGMVHLFDQAEARR